MCVDREGYSEAQIVTVSGRQDIDSGRNVERTELRKMQIELNRHKVGNIRRSLTLLTQVWTLVNHRESYLNGIRLTIIVLLFVFPILKELLSIFVCSLLIRKILTVST
jgi:hypothetical protein